jgi:hypothetical protein
MDSMKEFGCCCWRIHEPDMLKGKFPMVRACVGGYPDGNVLKSLMGFGGSMMAYIVGITSGTCGCHMVK